MTSLNHLHLQEVLDRVTKPSTLNTKALLAYADDIYCVGRMVGDLTEVFSKIRRESSKVGLVVNKGKTKIMLATAKAAGYCNVKVVE